jgi:hypothetical protein
MEEYASLTSMDESDAKEATPECEQLWNHLFDLIVPGTFHTAIWTDPLRKNWKEP